MAGFVASWSGCDGAVLASDESLCLDKFSLCDGHAVMVYTVMKVWRSIPACPCNGDGKT